MDIWVTVLLFLLGLLLIVKGGDWFLDGAVWIAEATGVPRFIIGATIVSLATTLPELTVSVTGVLQGEVDLAVGNAVGSVTANLGLILGISVLCLPSAVSKKQFNLKAILMVAGAACCPSCPVWRCSPCLSCTCGTTWWTPEAVWWRAVRSILPGGPPLTGRW